MQGTVLYRLVSPQMLRYGPVAVTLTPTGRIDVAVDQTQMDPLLAATLEGLSNEIMAPRVQLPEPVVDITTVCTIHRVANVGAAGLVAAEMGPGTLDILIDKDVIGPEIPPALSIHGTRILRHFII